MEKYSEEKLPAYIEETDEDKSDIDELVADAKFKSLIKRLNNRIAEHAQSMVLEKDITYATRIEELISILSEFNVE